MSTSGRGRDGRGGDGRGGGGKGPPSGRGPRAGQRAPGGRGPRRGSETSAGRGRAQDRAQDRTQGRAQGRVPAEAARAAPSAPERLHKLLSRHGIGSRREVEAWVAAGRMRINGEPAQPGAAASAADRIELDGRTLRLGELAPARVYAYRKRIGEIVSRDDPEGRPTVFRRLPRVRGGRWIAVGRLDINTSGLLLFTTDGELAARLMHPAYGIEREYAVRVLGGLSEEALTALREGVTLEDGPARVLAIAAEGPPDGQQANRWYRLLLAEGRNREVRRLIEAVGGQVSRLMRTRYGPIPVPSGVPSGRGRELEGDALAALYAAVELPLPAQAGPPPSRRR